MQPTADLLSGISRTENAFGCPRRPQPSPAPARVGVWRPVRQIALALVEYIAPPGWWPWILFHFWLWITRFSIISDPAALLYREFISCMIGWSGNNSKKRGMFVKERAAAANYTKMIIVAGPKTSRRRSHAMQRRWNCCCCCCPNSEWRVVMGERSTAKQIVFRCHFLILGLT